MPFKAEQDQFSHPFLIMEMLQSPDHLCSSLLDRLQELHVSVVLQRPALSTDSRRDLTRAEWQGRITSLEFLAVLFQRHPGFCWPSWPHGHSCSCTVWCPPGAPAPAPHSCFPPGWAQAVLVPRAVPPQVNDPAFSCVGLQRILL